MRAMNHPHYQRTYWTAERRKASSEAAKARYRKPNMREQEPTPLDAIAKAIADGDLVKLAKLMEPIAALIKMYSENVRSAQARYEQECAFLTSLMNESTRIAHAIASFGAKALDEQYAQAMETRQGGNEVPSQDGSAVLEPRTAVNTTIEPLYTAAAILEAVQAAVGQGWQGIDSAPKDGTNVLITGGTFEDDNCMAGSFPFVGMSIAHWTGQDFPNDSPWEGIPCHSHDDYRRHRPTHWMPLPEAPTPPEITHDQR